MTGKISKTIHHGKLTRYRREDIGFVFQFYNLIQNLTAIENVDLASQITKNPLDSHMVLQRVGLQERLNNFSSPVIRRGTTTGGNCPGDCQEPQTVAL